MSSKRILSVSIQLASDDVEECEFDSNISLLDWDIALFRPDIESFFEGWSDYQGKYCLTDSSSVRLKERSEHWRREIHDAMNGGKTVIVYLPSFHEVYVGTGSGTYQGTGKNAQYRRFVELYDNYQCIPTVIKPRSSSGSSMKLASKGAEILAPYWKEFEKSSEYEVILTYEKIPATVLTKSGDRTVGAIYRSKVSNGALVLLPNLDFYPDHFVAKSGEWTKAAQTFAARLISSIVALDKALKATGAVTPEPEWARAQEFVLESERKVRRKMLKIEEQLETLQRSKEELLDQASHRGRIRGLLYEKGTPLEVAIIDALHLLAFSAKRYRDSDSEFDVVFECAEGRLIGEAEGKDNKPINIDKLRQLAMNIHEDLEKETAVTPAKGVLFGNAYRLTPLAERADPFTKKCLDAARMSSVALVPTPDLFRVAKYISEQPDDAFTSSCRLAILNTVGLVAFPRLPNTDEAKGTVDVAVTETQV